MSSLRYRDRLGGYHSGWMLFMKNSKAPQHGNDPFPPLAERRIFPAIDIEKSSTRREDLLMRPETLQRVWLMRRMYLQMVSTPPHGAGMDTAVATEAILQKMEKTKTNAEFLENLADM